VGVPSCPPPRHPIEPQALREGCQPLHAQPEIDQGAEGHVPSNAAEGIENGYRHSLKSYSAAAVLG
jgi:hypothetical protein